MNALIAAIISILVICTLLTNLSKIVKYKSKIDIIFVEWIMFSFIWFPFFREGFKRVLGLNFCNFSKVGFMDNMVLFRQIFIQKYIK